MTSGSFTGNTLGKGLIVDYQWDLAEAKSRRRLYLVIFFLNMFVTAGVAAAGSLIIAYLVHIVFVSIFMFLLLSLAKKLLSWSTATIVVLFIVIGFIPFASLLAVVIIDHRLYNIIKQRDKGLKSPTAPVPSQPVQLQEKQIEKKLQEN